MGSTLFVLLLLGSPSTWTYILPHFEQLLPASITVSATLDENLSPQMPFSPGAEVLWPRTEATGVADAMIEAPSGLDHGVGHPLPSGLPYTCHHVLLGSLGS